MNNAVNLATEQDILPAVEVQVSPEKLQEALFAPDIAAVPQDWKDAASWQFESFVMHMHEDNCACGAVHRHSNVFRLFVRKLPAATDRRLIVAESIPATLRVIRVNMPARRVPLCHFCLTSDRAGQQTILVSSEAEWNEAQRREIAARMAGRNSRSAAPSGPMKPLADLL